MILNLIKLLSYGILFIYISYAVCSVFFMIALWLRSYFLKLKPEITNKIIDMRQDKNANGKVLELCLVKAAPLKSIWFGHLWINWQEPPPNSNGIAAAGYYAECKLTALRYLIISLISPFGIFTGQKPLKAVFADDSGVNHQAKLCFLIDEEVYEQAIKIDAKWRRRRIYSLRPKMGGRTYSCRDYVFEVLEVLGLNTKIARNKWAAFPPQSFYEFMKINNFA